LKHWRLSELMDHQTYMRETLLLMLPGILTQSGQSTLSRLLPASNEKKIPRQSTDPKLPAPCG
jgi:hypothetical protein